MIKPKYEIDFIFKDRIGYTYEVIDRVFDGKDFIYYVRNIDSGIIFEWAEKGIDFIVGGKNAKKPRKK